MNLLQYLVLIEGLGAVGTAAGVARESFRRIPTKLVAYGNLGVLLICVSLCLTLAANLSHQPTAATWLAAAGFGLYGVATVGAWLSRASFDFLRHHGHHQPGGA